MMSVMLVLITLMVFYSDILVIWNEDCCAFVSARAAGWQ